MATARVRSTLDRFRQIAETSHASGGQYLLGDGLSALDIYLATALAVVAPMPEDECPGVLPAVRRAFETAYPDITAAVPVALRKHRDFIYRRHLGLPIEL
jgi:glutathione S-transferase